MMWPYIVGIVLNAFSLCLFCRKNNWQRQGSVKFLMVTQYLFSLIVIACSFALEFANLLPQSCRILLPTTMVYMLSFAWSNLAVLLVVKHAELTSTWRLRFKVALVIIVTELVVCTAVEFPILYSSRKGFPIVFYNDHACSSCHNQTTANKEQVPLDMKINVISYSFWYIFVHFGIVGTLIVNRFLAIMMHLCYKEADDKQKPRQSCYNTAAHYLMNSLCIIVVNVFFMLLSVRLENNEETLNLLNKIFHAMLSFSVAVLCVPARYLWYDLDTGRSFLDLDENTGLISNKDEDMIIA